MKTKVLLLSCYLHDLKKEHPVCVSCFKPSKCLHVILKRKALSKKAILELIEQMDERTWEKLKTDVVLLCRFCWLMETAAPTYFLDLKGFYRYLIDQYRFCFNTVREYLVRLRRLDEYLSQSPHFLEYQSLFACDIEIVHHSQGLRARQNMLVAFRQYQRYLAWHAKHPHDAEE